MDASNCHGDLQEQRMKKRSVKYDDLVLPLIMTVPASFRPACKWPPRIDNPQRNRVLILIAQWRIIRPLPVPQRAVVILAPFWPGHWQIKVSTSPINFAIVLDVSSLIIPAEIPISTICIEIEARYENRVVRHLPDQVSREYHRVAQRDCYLRNPWYRPPSG